MKRKRFVVMGAGEVGFHLARTLSRQGHSVTVIETDGAKQERVEEELDAAVILGNGAHVPILEAAKVDRSDLFMAVSSSEESNLAAAILAKKLGAKRTVVRARVADVVTTYRRLYEDVFKADLLLSTELLATTHILNHVLGHNTLAVEHLAKGKVQLRKIHLEEGSILTRSRLHNVEMPRGSLVAAFFRGSELIIPSGADRAQPGDDALILCTTGVIDSVERLISSRPRTLGTVVIAGGGPTSVTVAKALSDQNALIKIVEEDRSRARQLAARFPGCQVFHGKATDVSLLRAERLFEASAFVAVSGNDEGNLMASLLAQEQGVPQVIALVDHTETSHLWRKLGLIHVVSPRVVAYQRIQSYIKSGYSANIVSLQNGAAQVIERRLAAASPAVGVTLVEINPPRGFIVGAVVRGDKVFVPRGNDRLEAGDTVILFVHKKELPTVQLLFPGLAA